MIFSLVIGLVRNCVGIFQGYLMVLATKLAIKQISVHEFNASLTIVKYAQQAGEIEKKIVMLIFANILISAILGFF